MRTFSFVIPTFNHYALLHQTLYDIYQKCSPVDEVIVVDDGSTDIDYHQGLNWWTSTKLLPIKIIHMEENSGFLKSSNTGLKVARGDIVCLLSNDVRIRKDLVTHILGYDPIELLFFGGRLLDWDTGWNKFGETVVPYIEGYFMAMTKDTWNALGGLDERYSPSDFEDVDLSMKAVCTGRPLHQFHFSLVSHKGGGSFGYSEERRQRTILHKERFRQKWALTLGKDAVNV